MTTTTQQRESYGRSLFLVVGLGVGIHVWMHVCWIVKCIVGIEPSMNLSCKNRIRYCWEWDPGLPG